MDIDNRRIFIRKQAEIQQGPVVYWMQRDQRTNDNWALLHAQELAISMHQPLIVAFCLIPGFLGATIRQYGFMLKGLAVTARKLVKHNIQFSLIPGLPQDVLPRFL